MPDGITHSPDSGADFSFWSVCRWL